MKNKKLSLFSLIILIVCLCLTPILAGCDSILGDGSGIGGGSVSGGGDGSGTGTGNGSDYVAKTYDYKIGYRPATADEASYDLVAALAEEILRELCYSYGAGVPGANTARMTTTGLNESSIYYDAIRQPIISVPGGNAGVDTLVGTDRKDWKWMFNILEDYLLGHICVKDEADNKYLLKKQDMGSYLIGTGTYYQSTDYINPPEPPDPSDPSELTYSKYYTQTYVKLYKDVLTLALYEILLGADYNTIKDYVGATCTYNITPVEIAITPSETTTIFYIDSTGLSVNWRGATNFGAALENAKARYSSFGNYYGFTTRDAMVIKEFILKSIIGQNVTNNNLTTGAKYETFVNALINSLIPSDESSTVMVEGVAYKDYSASARLLYKDVRGFMRDTESIDSMSAIDAQEYQSLIIMFNEPTSFGGLRLVFESERDLNIRMFMRFYNVPAKRETRTMLSYSDPRYGLNNGNYFPVTAGTYNSDTNDNSIEEELAFKNYTTIPAFDNNENVKASVQKPAIAQWNKVYKAYSGEPSFETISMFDEQNATTSFVEIVFSVDKQQTDALGTDYRFKFAIDGVNLED